MGEERGCKIVFLCFESVKIEISFVLAISLPNI